ncbi:MAG: helix-turn-helix transcriptional regulator [Pyrinomonadaceae bacterium]|nr:helix-turn-helix transcriptional regulator [Pyrinomonadaceae bacterium]
MFRMVEDIIGCKWSLSVLNLIKNGINRPGQMEQSVDGLSKKVLNERLRKLVRYRIVEKTVFPESPPRVEYDLTPFGLRFVDILEAIESLDREFSENNS